MASKKKITNIIIYIILVLVSIIWLFPFVCLVLQSFRSYNEMGGGMVDYVIPKKFSLDSYRFLFDPSSNFVNWYKNTLIISIFVTIGQTIFVLCTSYVLSRMRFKGRELFDEILANPWYVPWIFKHDLSLFPIEAVRSDTGRRCSRIDFNQCCKFWYGILYL